MKEKGEKIKFSKNSKQHKNSAQMQALRNLKPGHSSAPGGPKLLINDFSVHVNSLEHRSHRVLQTLLLTFIPPRESEDTCKIMGTSSMQQSFFFFSSSFFFFFFWSFQGHTCSIWSSQTRVQLELQPRPTPEPQQHGIQAKSATCTTAHSNTLSLNH